MALGLTVNTSDRYVRPVQYRLRRVLACLREMEPIGTDDIRKEVRDPAAPDRKQNVFWFENGRMAGA